MKTKSIRLADGMAEWLRREAFVRRRTQQSLIDEALANFRREVEQGRDLAEWVRTEG